MAKRITDEYLKLLTKNHYDKYTFIEPDSESRIRSIIKNKNYLFLDLVPLKDIKGSIIEVGCGTGKYLKILELAGKRDITGIDLSKNSLKIAKKYLKHAKLEEADATNLQKFRDDSFSTVICAGVAHHTPLPKKVFKECARLCKGDGLIIFAVYKKNSAYYYDYLVFSRIVKAIFKLKAQRIFFPFFRIWFAFLNGTAWLSYSNGKPVFDDKVLLSSVTDRYLSPVVKFFTLQEMKDWIKEENLDLQKVSYTCRKSVINLLMKK